MAGSAVEQTRARLESAQAGDGVELAVANVPEQWPDGQFDLVVISELGYFVTDIDALAQRIHGCLTDDGVLVACHWRHPVVEAPSTTEAVHAVLGAGLQLLVDHIEDDFVLQIWSRRAGSVAQATGVVS